MELIVNIMTFNLNTYSTHDSGVIHTGSSTHCGIVTDNSLYYIVPLIPN